jgi:integrase
MPVANYIRDMATASVRARHGGYLFQRPGSANWYVKLRSPGAKRKEVSLGTSDKLKAEILAAPLIADHKAALLAARPRLEPTWWHQLSPGLHEAPALVAIGYTLPEGGRIFATDRELHYLDASGATTRTARNGMAAYRLVGRGPEAMRLLTNPDRPAVPTKNGDDSIFETYLKHANVTGYPEREARDVWALYKTLTDSKPLKDSTRDDGRKLVAHFEGEGLKSATIQKKLMWLSAACNLAIKEGRLKFNPFSSVVPKRDDKQTRLPLNEADIAGAKRNLGGLDMADQLLFRLLAATGMRLSEAFDIDGEAIERGIRYVIVGKKTEQSLRRIPLPANVLPHLPKTIKGKLFVGDTPTAASKRLNRFLRDVSIADPRKVVHSLRHRAQDRLRAAGCPQDIRWAILGHEEKTVAAGYGEGFPVTLLRKWIDRIGF